MSDDGKTHWEDCWKCHGHSACAVRKVADLERRLEGRTVVTDEQLIRWAELCGRGHGADVAREIWHALEGNGELSLPAVTDEPSCELALGFAHAWCCTLLDRGEDPRKVEVPQLREDFYKALEGNDG